MKKLNGFVCRVFVHGFIVLHVGQQLRVCNATNKAIDEEITERSRSLSELANQAQQRKYFYCAKHFLLC